MAKKRYRRRIAKINLEMLFDGYCRNFANVYDDKFAWTKWEGRQWLTHGILRFFRSLGESMGFDVALEKQIIGNIRLKSRGDMFWIKDEKPILHLESENADYVAQITEELRNLGSSNIPYKVGVFQCINENLNRKIIPRVRKFLAKKALVRDGTQWLLIFDIWYDTALEDVEYSYTDRQTKKHRQKKYRLEYYPLIGMILREKSDKEKMAKVYCLPFDKIGVINGRWETLTRDV